MIRLAMPGDAEGLFELNLQFNGPGGAEVEEIAESLAQNPQEVVVVSEGRGGLNGFVCLQVKRSFCYQRPAVEVAEVFVAEAYRRQGLARAMLDFGRQYCAAKYGAVEFTVLTGAENFPAQALYAAAGFVREDEVLFAAETPARRHEEAKNLYL